MNATTTLVDVVRGVGVTLVQSVQPGVGLFIDGIYQPNTAYLNNPLLDVERIARHRVQDMVVTRRSRHRVGHPVSVVIAVGWQPCLVDV